MPQGMKETLLAKSPLSTTFLLHGEAPCGRPVGTFFLLPLLTLFAPFADGVGALGDLYTQRRTYILR